MVGAATAEYRVFQRGAQARQGFTGIQQLRAGACQQVNVAAYFTGNARERLHKIERGAFTSQQDAGRAVQFEQWLIRRDRIAVLNVPCYLHLVARQLGKDLLNPAFAAENPCFTGDNHRMRACLFWQQLGGNIVIGADVTAEVFSQGMGNACRDITINTFQKRVTSVVGVIAARRHDKTPNW